MVQQQAGVSISGVKLRFRPAPVAKYRALIGLAKRTALIGLAWAIALAPAPPLHAQSYSIIHSFNRTDGEEPSSVTLDAAGNIYGTTATGGSGHGTVYKLTRTGSGWRLSTLYEFSGQSDGSAPQGGVIIGPDGSLYGLTTLGGARSLGTIYKLQPPSSACKTALCYWTETVLYSFSNTGDGAVPYGNVAFDRAGNMYGTTSGGGLYEDFGSVWELSRSGGQWTFSVIHAFANGGDGGVPYVGVVLDETGNLYGVTQSGGSSHFGVAYEFTSGPSGWSETVLHNFGGGQDGAGAYGLAFDAHGNLFGVTEYGGNQDYGTIYELQAANGGFSYSIVYNFQQDQGGIPECVPIFDAAGNLYGTGLAGSGGNEYGILYELSPSGGSWTFTLLHIFFNNGSDGVSPEGSMGFDTQGNLFGGTISGGTSEDGTVWEYSP